MAKKLITLEKAEAITNSISKIGLEYIELSANGNNPPTIKQDTKFYLINSSGIGRYILETGDRTFSWGTGDFPSISDGTWYIYSTDSQTFGNIIPDVGLYGASKNVPTYDQVKNGWYNSDGRVVGQFTVTASVVSNILVINQIQINNNGDVVFNTQCNFNDVVNSNNTIDSTSKDTGSIIIEGGIGVEKNIHVGGTIKNDNNTQSISKDTGAIVAVNGGIGAEKNIHAGGTIKSSDTTDSSSKDTGSIITEGGLGVEKNIHAGGTIKNNDTTDSSSKDTGSITTEGGVGVEKNINAGGEINAIKGHGPTLLIDETVVTQGEMFDILKIILPTIDDYCLLSGGAQVATGGDSLSLSYAKRQNANQISMVSYNQTTTGKKSDILNDGSGTVVFDLILAAALKIKAL